MSFRLFFRKGSPAYRSVTVTAALCLGLLSPSSPLAGAGVPEGGLTWRWDPFVQTLDSRQGLPNPNDLVIGPLGFVWIGTYGGLFRFDGETLEAAGDHRGRRFGTVTGIVVEPGPSPAASHLWLGTPSGLVRYDLESKQTSRLGSDPKDPRSLPHPHVRALLLDRDGVLWVGTDKGLARLGDDRRVETRWGHLGEEDQRPGRLSGQAIRALYQDGRGRIFVATTLGAYLFRREDESFELLAPEAWGDRSIYDPESQGLFAGDATLMVRSMAEDRQGRVLFATWGGALVLDETSRRLEPFEPLGERCPEVDWRRVHGVSRGPSGDLLVAGSSGLARLGRDPADDLCVGGRGLPGGAQRVVEDEQGTLWTVELTRGVRRLPSSARRFTRVVLRPAGATPADPDLRLRGIAVAPDGHLWSASGEILVRTAWDGRLPRVVSTFDSRELGFPGPPVSSSALVADGENVWWPYRGGLAKITYGTSEVRFFPHDPDGDRGPGQESIHHLFPGTAGSVWISHGNVERFDPETERFETFGWAPNDSGYSVQGAVSLFEDKRGRAWLGAAAGGLYVLDPATREWSPVYYDPARRHHGDQSIVMSMVEDDGERLWLGTVSAGVELLDPDRRLVRRFDPGVGFPSELAMQVGLDDDGFLWATTSVGLVRLDPDTGESRIFNHVDGWTGDGAPRGVHRLGRSMVVTLPQGPIRFFPSRLEGEAYVPPLYLTGLEVNNSAIEVRPDDPKHLLQRSLVLTERLVLGPEDRVVTFEMSSPYFTQKARQKYRYRLDGFDEDWQEAASHEDQATYTSLPAGSYTFRAQASNGAGRWGGREVGLAVVVRPPWWQTYWAYAAYFLLFLGSLYAIYRHQQHKLEREQWINRRLRRLDRLKDDFLANTSHELRTPLFGIAGLAEALAERLRKDLPARDLEDLRLITTSCRRLTGLINDLLDFSKLRRQDLQVGKKPVELHSTVDVVLTLSRGLVKADDLRLINRVEPSLGAVAADPDRLEQILQNLVGNAVKFAGRGDVVVSAERLDDERVVVSVTDDGPGIAPEDQHQIFSAFHQGASSVDREAGGTGLGLAISRQLVELQGGRMWVESSPGEGASFKFDLPLWTGEPPGAIRPGVEDAEAIEGARTPDPAASPIAEAGSRNGSAPHRADGGRTREGQPPAAEVDGRILIVDDEPINLRVLHGYLSGQGREILHAGSGEEAVGLLQKERVDLVVLDIMMPRMSGYEVCRRIRERWPLEEMPIIFLTAKAQVEDRIAGFKEGGNDYLIKPVARDELRVRIDKELQLLSMHRKLSEEVQTISGLLPICASCKRVRDDKGYWEQIESYIGSRSEALFTHSICPGCAETLYGDLLGKGESEQAERE